VVRGGSLAAIPLSRSRLEAGPAPILAPTPEPSLSPLGLYGLEFSLDTASLDALEAVARAVTRAEVEAWFARRPGIEEVALLSTCHRIELVLLARNAEAVEEWRSLLPGTPSAWRLREDRDAVRHLFRVAAGRESLAVGEAEVARQVLAAAHGIESRHPRPVLRELFETAAATATELAAARPLSIAAVAAERLRSLLRVERPRVLVVGSGIVGRQVVESLGAGARITVVYHQRPPDTSFLRSHDARAVPWEDLGDELARADAVVTAAKFGNHGLGASDLPSQHPLVLVDLGMPRNIDPDVRSLPNVRLVDLEELHARPVAAPGAPSEDRLDLAARRCAERLQVLLFEPWIDAFRRAAEEVRRSELTTARSYLGALRPEQELAVDRLTRRLVARLLLAPTERIRSLPPGPEGEIRRRWAVELLRPPSDEL
jgi:glutamyl-tRNA reductase